MMVIWLYWFAVQKQTSTFRCQKTAVFMQNLVWNAVSLLLASKTDRKWGKNCKNQTMFEKRK